MPAFIVKADGIITTVNKLLTINANSFFTSFLTNKIYNANKLVSLITNFHYSQHMNAHYKPVECQLLELKKRLALMADPLNNLPN